MLWVVTCPRGGVGATPNFRNPMNQETTIVQHNKLISSKSYKA